MRDLLTTVAELAGAACIVAGVFVLVGLGAALVVGGAALIVLGYLASGGADV